MRKIAAAVEDRYLVPLVLEGLHKFDDRYDLEADLARFNGATLTRLYVVSRVAESGTRNLS